MKGWDLMPLDSAYDSLEYEGKRRLKKYKKELALVNQLAPYFRDLDDEALKKEADIIAENFSLKNRKLVQRLYALTREVTYRLLGKFQYDVQVIGALAALDRNMIQMATGSGKTITLILPAVAFGMTHKGVNILTVNEYLSKRDWEETRPIYDWFGLTNAYTGQEDEELDQREAFACDITYSTNSTLGFAYLRSALASDIGRDLKIITRPLHAAIIDEADEILMDDARNPLIIADSKDISGEFSFVEHKGQEYSVIGILDKLRNLTTIGYDEDSMGTVFLDDKALDEILYLLDLDESIFSNPAMMHVIYSSVNALFGHKLYEDYVVLPEPDPDSQSRIALIDKATGRLASGRTLSDNMHAFIEMKEHVFTGSSSDSLIQITYQIFFNLFETISGVSGTLGSSFKEFIDIYQTGILIVPDRLPNRLQQKTHLYTSHVHLMDDLVKKTRFYMSAHMPVLIGAASDIEADLVATKLKIEGITHKLLVSTDDNEEAIVEGAGKPGSVVVTTDIMGRGTDIHVEDTEQERGLVVLQVGSRPNSRVERQFAGRAARQGQPGRYHRMLTLPELKDLGYPKSSMEELLDHVREHRFLIESYQGDVLLDGLLDEYDDIVFEIDESLRAQESAVSSSRIEDFNSFSITDVIQTGLLNQMDDYRRVVADSISGKSDEGVYLALALLSLDEAERENKRLIKKQLAKVKELPIEEVRELVFAHTQSICNTFIPALREYSDNAVNTVKMSQQVKYEVRPEIFMTSLIQKFLRDHKDSLKLEIEV